jgi:KaiC/GvpD/RAD55 family RecA-like ATPase
MTVIPIKKTERTRGFYDDVRGDDHAPALSADQITFSAPHMVEASDQIISAKINLLRRPDEDWIDFPWPELARLCGVGTLPGAMKPRDIWMIVGFSGNGKTLVVTSMIEWWASVGVKVYAMPLENAPDDFRLYMACQKVGLDPGIVNSGGLRWMAKEDRERWEALIDAELDRQLFDPVLREMLKVKGVDAITPARLKMAAEEASDWGAKVCIVDHMDQMEVAAGQTAVSQSQLIGQTMKTLAKRHELCWLATSQLNNEAVRGGRDFLAQFGPAQPHHILNGSHKRNIATGIINIHRKIRARRDGETAKDFAKAIRASQRGDAPVMDALEPGTMAMTLMKGRNNGGKETHRIFLGVEHGRIRSLYDRNPRDP